MRQLPKKTSYFSILAFAALLASCGGKDDETKTPNQSDKAIAVDDKSDEVANPEELVVMVALDAESRNFYATEDEVPVFGKKMFDKAEPFVDGVAKVGKKENDSTMLYTYIDAKGNELFEYKYTDVGHFSDGMAWIKVDGKYGYIDKEGNEIVPPKYLNNWNYNNGRLLISDKKYNSFANIQYSHAKFGYLNKEGDTIIPLKYKWAKSFNGGLAPVMDNRKIVFIDTNGEKAFDQTFDNADEFRNEIAPVMSNGKVGFIDQKGDFIISPKYQDYKYLYEYNLFNFSSRSDDKDRSKVYQTDEGYFIVSKNNKWGVIDIDENIIIPFNFDGIGIPDNNIVEINKVKRKKAYSTDYYSGLYDLSSKELILPAQYDAVEKFRDEGNEDWYELGIKTNPDEYSTDLHGFFNAANGKLIEPKFYEVDLFSEGLASVQEAKDGKYGYINEDGEIVIDFQYDSSADFKDGKAFVNKDGNYIYIDKKGNEIKD